jgi:hypothetical protein
MIVLDLFAGSGSFRKGLMRAGHNQDEITSIDIKAGSYISLQTDFLEWDYTQHPIPDVIFASPPCQTWSLASHRHRQLPDLTPQTPEAEEANRLVIKMIECIQHFKQLNPSLIYFIENPRARLRRFQPMQGLPDMRRVPVSYCAYGMPFRKSTDIFTNSREWRGTHCSCKKHTVDYRNTAGKKVGTIPELLVDEMIESL